MPEPNGKKKNAPLYALTKYPLIFWPKWYKLINISNKTKTVYINPIVAQFVCMLLSSLINPPQEGLRGHGRWRDSGPRKKMLLLHSDAGSESKRQQCSVFSFDIWFLLEIFFALFLIFRNIVLGIIYLDYCFFFNHTLNLFPEINASFTLPSFQLPKLLKLKQ